MNIKEFLNQFSFDKKEGERKEFQVYFVPEGTESAPFWLGKGNDDMGMAMNPQTEEMDDVQGNYIYNVQTYRKSMTIDPLNLDGNDPYSVAVAKIILGELTYKDCELDYLVVMVPLKKETGESFAFKQKGVISADTLAGGIGAINMTHTVSFVGERILGTLDISTKTFSPESTLMAGAFSNMIDIKDIQF